MRRGRCNEGVDLVIPPLEHQNSTDADVSKQILERQAVDWCSSSEVDVLFYNYSSTKAAGALLYLCSMRGKMGGIETVIGMLDEQEEYTIPMFGLFLRTGRPAGGSST